MITLGLLSQACPNITSKPGLTFFDGPKREKGSNYYNARSKRTLRLNLYLGDSVTCSYNSPTCTTALVLVNTPPLRDTNTAIHSLFLFGEHIMWPHHSVTLIRQCTHYSSHIPSPHHSVTPILQYTHYSCLVNTALSLFWSDTHSFGANLTLSLQCLHFSLQCFHFSLHVAFSSLFSYF